jgi:hypothetical protein
VRELGTSDQERELPRDKVLTSENSVNAKFADFVELRKAEVRLRRNLLPGTWVDESRLQSTFRTMFVQPLQPYLEILFV